MNDEPTANAVLEPRIGGRADEVDTHGGDLAVSYADESLHVRTHSSLRLKVVSWTSLKGVEPRPSRAKRPDHDTCVECLPVQAIRLCHDLKMAEDVHHGGGAPAVQVAAQEMD